VDAGGIGDRLVALPLGMALHPHEKYKRKKTIGYGHETVYHSLW
jgi:hypothetical protein